MELLLPITKKTPKSTLKNVKIIETSATVGIEEFYEQLKNA